VTASYDCDTGVATIEQTPEAEELDRACQCVAEGTLYKAPSCNSWYLGHNIPRKRRIFMYAGGYPPYRRKCEQVVASGYDGLALG
jgi:cyclohexanone monooxygenase